MLKIYSMDIKTEKFDADELETELNIELAPIELEETNTLLDESQKEGEIFCPFCQKAFNKKSNLNIHINSVHEKKKPHKCDICQTAFATRGTLKQHTTQVHEKVKIILLK